MFDTVIHYLETLSAGGPAEFKQDDRNLAVAALFYHMIAVDGVVKPVEKMRFCELLTSRFGLSEERLLAFSIRASQADMQSSGLFPFTSIINHECSEAEKIEIVEQIRSLAQADGKCHPLELEFINNVAELLKLPLPRKDVAAE